MKEIEMMNELVKKSSDILNQYNNNSYLNRDKMLREAKMKISNYLDEVLKVTMFDTVNVEISDYLSVYIRKNSDKLTTKEGRTGSKSITIDDDFIVIGYGKMMYQAYFTFNDEHVGHYWHNDFLRKPSEGLIIEIVKNFDKFKDEIKKVLLNRAKNYIDKNGEKIENRHKENRLLEEFLVNEE